MSQDLRIWRIWHTSLACLMFFYGRVAEWSKARAWKVRIGAKTSIKGSNPFSSAIPSRAYNHKVPNWRSKPE